MPKPDLVRTLKTDDIYAKAAAVAAVFAIVAAGSYFFYSKPPFDPFGYLIGRDFVNTWMGARATLAGDPKLWFDFAAYTAALHQMFGADFPQHSWSYPPHLLLLIWPFGYLPYLAAYVMWTVVGFALYLTVAAGKERRLEDVFMLAVAPAVLANVLGGQNGFFSAALLIGGLSLLDRRPIISGVLFGLLTIKPQLGVLLPLILVLTGRWRCIASAAATTCGLVAATCAVFGADIWVAFWKDAVPMQREVLIHGVGYFLTMMPTPFANARLLGLPLSSAWAVQAVVSATVIAAVVWTFWRQRDPVLSVALFVTASLLVTPYAFNYDMVVFGWVLIQLRRHHPETGSLDHALALAVWTLPVVTMILGFNGVPISSVILIAFAARLVRRMAASETHSSRAAADPLSA